MEKLIIDNTSDKKAALFIYGKDGGQITFDPTIEMDEIMEWLYKNTEKRFHFYGTNILYFESTTDAFSFKMRWL